MALAVKDVMTEEPVTVGREQSIAVAHALMRKNRCTHLPVLEHGELVGVVSQHDLYLVETLANADGVRDRVDEAMRRATLRVTPDASIADVARAMVRESSSCAVVVERDRVVGVFTATDALVVLAKLGGAS